jgi:indolepyruvate ferredoxin oxidoreductase alpha subunit
VEVSFSKEIESLRLGAGETFHGEGILAITKGLLQSGVAYVGGYQGAPVSHLMDVLVQAKGYMDELGVHVEVCSNEASAAAMLGASIHYPLRGAVTWKSIVGTNVAADALSNLSSPGVKGGVLVVVGEDYGEGASVIQERSHAFAMKSALWLLDPRPDLTSLVRLVRQGFELSEASNTPVMMELRIRSCHLQGSFVAADNVAPAVSSRQLQSEPAAFSYDRLSHPPSTFRHEKLKYEVRMPAARRFIVEHAINEVIDGDATDLRELGLIVQGGLTHTLLRAMAEAGLTDGQDRPRLALLVLNCVYPLVPEQITAFCSGRRAVLVLEEGQPDYIEQDIATTLRRAGVSTPLHGKDLLSMGGEYNAELLLGGLMRLLQAYRLDAEAGPARARLAALEVLRETARRELGSAVPLRPPNFCIGCPERPVFAALKLVEQQIGRVHVAADIGCHSFATFEPFSFGQSILGYGMSMASSAAVKNFSARRPLAIMGDGGFWHNGLLSGVSSTLLNGGDGVLLIMKNGYTSATGTQETISTPGAEERHQAEGRSATGNELTIEKTLAGLGVKWLRTVHNYRVASVRDTLREALTSPFTGLKVIVAEGECQLERQRRLRPRRAARLARGERVVRTRYGVDEATCSGDHSCIRLSGCPTLTVKTAGDPLKRSPVAHVQNECVGCGLCGEVAHAAVLCPSFYRAEVITHPGWWERLADRINRVVIGWLQPA